MGRLFSASDDGKVFMWDLHVEKIIQKYSMFDEESRLENNTMEETK